jgi:glyoxylase-like metal-dependent hydrolase (beta-lactamase superfamily II)
MSTAATPSIGRPGDPAAVRSLTFDDVVATYVVDGVLLMRPSVFFPDVPADYWRARPELCTANGDLAMSAGALLVERGGTTLLIDAGVGTMTRDFSFGRVDCGSMLDVLHALGRRPEDIGLLAFTHLHFDHAGWAYAKGAKTFPNARYVLANKEWAPYADGDYRSDATTPRHVISQLATELGAVELLNDGDEIVAGVHAVVAPGHTPGHTAYVITSRAGRRLVVFGDAFHTPAQLAHPEWVTSADSNPTDGISARRRLLAELSEANTLGFGFHFGDQPFGRVTTDGTGEAGWAPVPTSVLAAPPR